MTQRTLRYAGVGPRITPVDQLQVMTRIAQYLAKEGWHLSTGFGEGADEAFSNGAPFHLQTLWVPWQGFRKAYGSHVKVVPYDQTLRSIAADHHPHWHNMKDSTQALMVRNVAILLGADKREHVDMVIYWQSEENEKSLTSGTNHTLRVASTYGIPCFNIRLEEDRHGLSDYIEQLTAMNQ